MSPIQLEDEQYFFFEAMLKIIESSKSAFPNLSKIVVQKDIKLF